MSNCRGFSLLELIAVGVILSILLVLIWPSYQRHIKDVRLDEAKMALICNAQFMERWYLQNGSYKANATTWPTLPYIETEFFNIVFSSKAKGAAIDRYYLRAIAKDMEREPRYLVLDQFSGLKICDKNKGRIKCKQW